MRLIRAFRDCKQRSLTVSKKAPTVSKRASPFGDAPLSRKILVSVKFLSVILGPEMAAPIARSAGKTMSIKFFVLGGGGVFWVLGGGGECRFYFTGARICLN